jgi:hypothetical protein
MVLPLLLLDENLLPGVRLMPVQLDPLATDLDLAPIRERDAASAETWFKGPQSATAMAIRDRRAMLAEIRRLRDELAAADDLLSCAEASQDLEGATAEDWDGQMDAWRKRNGFGSET